MKHIIQITAVFFILNLTLPATARYSKIDIDSTNLKEHGFSVNASSYKGIVHFNLEFSTTPDTNQIANLNFSARLTLKAKGKFVAEAMLDVIKRENSALYRFSFSEDLLSESALLVTIGSTARPSMVTFYRLKLRDFQPKINNIEQQDKESK